MLFASCRKGAEDRGNSADHKPHWSYSGETGPENWGKLDKSFEACALGKTQSPVDIAEPFEKSEARLSIHYSASLLKVANNGHTVQVNAGEGSFIKFKDKEFKLIQYHFHTPSENLIKGQSFPMELHLVHKSESGELAVIGVMLQEGAENPAIASVWKIMPAKEGEAESSETVNPSDLLPAKRTFYSFSGSLTTPPCSEGVNWIVMAEPVTVSRSQIDAFKALFAMNARPVQNRAGRSIQVSG